MNGDDSKNISLIGKATNASRISDDWEFCTVNAQISADMFTTISTEMHSVEQYQLL